MAKDVSAFQGRAGLLSPMFTAGETERLEDTPVTLNVCGKVAEPKSGETPHDPIGLSNGVK